MTRPRRKPLCPTRTEQEVSRQVVAAARALGVDLARQNTGAGVNPAGKLVRFGTPGDSDYRAVLPDGRYLACEVKREGFEPAKLRGAKREHFDRQLAGLRRINESNGVAFWVDDAEDFLVILRHVLAGARVVEPGYGRPEVVYPERKDSLP